VQLDPEEDQDVVDHQDYPEAEETMEPQGQSENEDSQVNKVPQVKWDQMVAQDEKDWPEPLD